MGAGDGHEGGETVEAGLPDITGIFEKRRTINQNNEIYNDINATYGAFSSGLSEGGANSLQLVTTSGSIAKMEMIKFNSSRSNPIYGASDTVQPSGYYFYFWRRVS